MANNIKITIENDATPEVKATMKRRVRGALNAAGIQAASLARDELQATPKRIDTGLLRNSITSAMDGASPRIGGYKASRKSKYTGKKPPPGHYEGTTPKEPEGKTAVYIGTNVKYAIYVHDGTQDMEANRFLKKAVEDHAAELVDIIKRHLMKED